MSILHQQIVSALREAGDEGLDESEIMALGGMWWRNRLEEIRRWKLAVIGEQDGRFYLVGERGAERAVSTSSVGANEVVASTLEGDAGLIPRASADGSLSPERLVLFPSGSSHYELDEAA